MGESYRRTGFVNHWIFWFSLGLMLLLVIPALGADSDFVIDSNGVLTEYSGTALNVVIPDSVTAIGDLAFYENKSLASISIPDSVRSIGVYAFSGCSRLIEVIIPGSVETIGEYAFDTCSSLESITLAYGVKTIDSGAFQLCSNLSMVKLPDSLLAIGDSAFSGCSGLSAIEVPASVAEIGVNAFDSAVTIFTYRNSAAAAWTNDNGSQVRFLDDFEIDDHGVLTAYTGMDADVEIPTGITAVGSMAFSSNTSVWNVLIPETVTIIGDSAFDGCSSLESVDLPASLIAIGDMAFNGCERLASIDIPDSVESIGAFAFCGCKNLNEVTIPGNAATIGGFAFESCSGLRSLTIQSGVQQIGEYAFSECSALSEVVIPDSVTSIGDEAFDSSVTVIASEGSAAEQWAEVNQRPFRLIGAETPTVETPTTEVTNTPTEETPTVEGTDTPTVEITETPTAETPTAEGTDTPTVETPTAEITETPTEETPTAEITETPTEETPTAEITEAPTAETPTAEITETPTEETPTAEITETLTAETPTAEVTNTPTEETPTAEVTDTPTEETPTAEVTNTPTEETPTAEVTNTPMEETSTAEVTNTPTEETSTAEVTDTPTEETPTAEITETPTVETPTAEVTNTPTAETPTADVTNTPTEETPTGEITESPTAETPTADVTNTPTEETPTAEVTDTPTEETPTADVTNTPTKETPTADVTNTPTKETPTAEVTDTPTEETPTVEITETPTAETPTADVTNTPTEETPTTEVTNTPTEETPTAEITETSTVGTPIPEVTDTPTADVTDTPIVETPVATAIITPEVDRFSLFTFDDTAYVNVTGKTVPIDAGSGLSLHLNAFAPGNYTPAVTWKSGAPKIAKVDENGNITGVKAGTAKITASLNGTKISSSVTIKVVSKVQPGSLSINGADGAAVKKTAALKAVFNQAVQPTNKAVTWTSSDPKVAKVSSKGVVTGVSKGSATITVCSKENLSICASKIIRISQPVSKVTIESDDDITQPIDIGSTGYSYESLKRQLFASVQPEDAAKGVIWKSSAPKIASVDETGLVTVHKAGTATITATAADGTKKAGSVKIEVVSKVQPGSLTISGAGSVAVKKTITLKPLFNQTVQPTNKSVVWKTSDSSVAKISSKGVVTGIAKGSATITVCAKENNSICNSIPIEVSQPAVSVRILDADVGNMVIDLGTTGTDQEKLSYQLTAVITPESAAQRVTWKSKNPKIAVVSENGLVTGLKSGTTVISAATMDGTKKTASVKIIVTSNVQPNSIRISGPDEIAVKKTAKLSVSFDQNVQPVSQTVIWGSSNPGIAKVSSTGVVTGVSAGSVTVNACVKGNSSLCAEFPISVAGPSNGAASVDSIPEMKEEASLWEDALPAGESVAVPDIAEKDAPGPAEEIDDAITNSDNSEMASGLRFGNTEVWLYVGESLPMDVVNPGEVNYIIMLGQSDAAAYNEETALLTGLAEGDATLYLADEATVEIVDQMLVHVMSEPSDTGEKSESSEAPVETAEAETESNTPVPGIPVIEMESGEIEMVLSEMAQLVYESGKPVFYGSSDLSVAAVDAESGLLMAVGLGETSVYVAEADPVEVKAMLHVIVKEAESTAASDQVSADEFSETSEDVPDDHLTEELIAEPEDNHETMIEPTAEGEPISEVKAEDDSGLTETVEPVAESPENAEEGVEIGSVEDTVDVIADSEGDLSAAEDNILSVEPTADAIAEENEAEAEPVKLMIRDLSDNGLVGTEGSILKIEKERFELNHGDISALYFTMEDETVAQVTERGAEDVAVNGLEISLLTSGETRLLIGFDGEEPLLVIRISVSAVPEEIKEDPIENENYVLDVPEEPTPDSESMTVSENVMMPETAIDAEPVDGFYQDSEPEKENVPEVSSELLPADVYTEDNNADLLIQY